LIQNSFGPNWGEEGSARILRGVNYLGIEASCFAAKLKSVTSQTINTNKNEGNAEVEATLKEPFPINKPLTPSQNQLNPNYCDASWAFAVLHSLADSELARSNGTKVRSFSAQALLNCGVGTCEKGGDPY